MPASSPAFGPTAIVRLGGPINERVPGVRAASTPTRSAESVASDLRAARAAGASAVAFVGGEPTLRPDLRVLLRLARRLGLSPALCTNGRMLVYPAVRQALVAERAALVRVRLHAAHPHVHDRMVGVVGAFDQTWQGLQSLVEQLHAQQRVEVACTITADNLDQLGDWTDLMAGLAPHRDIQLRLVASWRSSESAAPPPSLQVADAVHRAVGRVRQAGGRTSVVWEGLPRCQLPGLEELADESLRTSQLVFGPPEAGTAMLWEPAGTRAHALPCHECALEPACPGPATALVGLEGHQVLKPVPGARANSFNYELVRSLPGFRIRSGDCSATTLEVPGPAARFLLLDSEGTVSLFHTPTRDFDESRIEQVKSATEQLYLDPGSEPTLDTFLTDVRRARLHPECKSCPARRSCLNAFIVDDALPFEAEERWLQDRIARLRGDVLDVGCGEQLYRDRLRTLIDEGAVRYVGIDPDRHALDRLAASVPGTRLECVAIEGFEAPASSFDTALCLRSVHHFRDLRGAFGALARLLRPGGRLVLCDSPPFAMLRTAEQVRAADRATPAGHQHYRNFDSHQVIERVKGLPFDVVEHRPVTRATSSEWLLELQRIG